MEPGRKKARMGKNKCKENKKKYYKQAKKHLLQPGQRGFLATCNMNEKACVRECYNLLNYYADELYKSEPDTSKDCDYDSDDFDAAIAKCKEEFSHRNARFQNVDTGTTNCLFIRTKLEDPVELGKYIVEDIIKTAKPMSRFILRLVPIEAVCRANMPDIINAAGLLFDKYFLKEPTTYGIIFNHRYNQQIKRDHIIKELADLVNAKNIGNKVDLQHAKKSIIVEVLRGWCLLSVIDNYLGCKKYNLAELIYPSKKKTDGEGTAVSNEAVEKNENSVETAVESSDGTTHDKTTKAVPADNE
ncbi:hypothetical protein KR093_007841 [Drosophila rubida]|uniref:THUMP domain-containing protein n=1 Tax=Drosophila rubida TaxID=30044 RepID=A0AAD4K377_9MUSC|nr:hypothetical protein KR093_007841 [Drosophila rubida]